MGLSSRWGFRQLSREASASGQPLPDEVIDAIWEHFDHGTQRAILRLYRSAPEELPARAGERLGGRPAPGPPPWGADEPPPPPPPRRGLFGRRGLHGGGGQGGGGPPRAGARRLVPAARVAARAVARRRALGGRRGRAVRAARPSPLRPLRPLRRALVRRG